jgi:hypothetical protein
LIVLSQSTDLLYARHVVPHNPMKEKEREKKENTFYVVPSLSDGAHEVAERFDHGAVISSRWRFNSNLPPRPFPSTLLDGRRGININCVGESPLFFRLASGAGMRCIRIIYYLQCTHMFRVRFVFPSER